MPYNTDARDLRLSSGGAVRTLSRFNQGDIIHQAIPQRLAYNVGWSAEPPSGKDMEMTAILLVCLGDQDGLIFVRVCVFYET